MKAIGNNIGKQKAESLPRISVGQHPTKRGANFLNPVRAYAIFERPYRAGFVCISNIGLCPMLLRNRLSALQGGGTFHATTIA